MEKFLKCHDITCYNVIYRFYIDFHNDISDYH